MSERSFVLKRDEGNQKSSKRTLAIIPSPERNTERGSHRERNARESNIERKFFLQEEFLREREEFSFFV